MSTTDGTLYALDPTEGSPRWQLDVGTEASSIPAAADGRVYVGSDDESLRAFDAADGGDAWSYAMPDWIRSDPLVVDDTVYVGSD